MIIINRRMAHYESYVHAKQYSLEFESCAKAFLSRHIRPPMDPWNINHYRTTVRVVKLMDTLGTFLQPLKAIFYSRTIVCIVRLLSLYGNITLATSSYSVPNWIGSSRQDMIMFAAEPLFKLRETRIYCHIWCSP